MKLPFLVGALMIAFTIHAQDLPRIEKDTLFTTSGYNIVDGSRVKIGTGTLPDGRFKFITSSSRSWAAGLEEKDLRPLNRKSAGMNYKVKKFRKEGGKKNGYRYYVIIGAGDIENYEIDIENAIAAGEVELPEELKKKEEKAAATPVVVKTEGSAADEIKKLKQLYDEGILTKEEFEAAKKKILDKQ